MISRFLIGKVIINGIIETVTGIHIGTSRETLEIGGLDNPVITDPVTKEPYIPGSSLKGKLRSLLERATGKDKGMDMRNIGTSRFPIYIHVCRDADLAINCPVCRLFGSSGASSEERNFPARLKFRDCYLPRYCEQELRERKLDFLYTELKWENALDRITAAANPRSVERVPAGTHFAFEIVYDVEDTEYLKEDLQNLTLALKLLEDDYLGGMGSRGYGKVHFMLTSAEAKKLKHTKA